MDWDLAWCPVCDRRLSINSSSSPSQESSPDNYSSAPVPPPSSSGKPLTSKKNRSSYHGKHNPEIFTGNPDHKSSVQPPSITDTRPPPAFPHRNNSKSSHHHGPVHYHPVRRNMSSGRLSTKGGRHSSRLLMSSLSSTNNGPDHDSKQKADLSMKSTNIDAEKPTKTTNSTSTPSTLTTSSISHLPVTPPEVPAVMESLEFQHAIPPQLWKDIYCSESCYIEDTRHAKETEEELSRALFSAYLEDDYPPNDPHIFYSDDATMYVGDSVQTTQTLFPSSQRFSSDSLQSLNSQASGSGLSISSSSERLQSPPLPPLSHRSSALSGLRTMTPIHPPSEMSDEQAPSASVSTSVSSAATAVIAETRSSNASDTSIPTARPLHASPNFSFIRHSPCSPFQPTKSSVAKPVGDMANAQGTLSMFTSSSLNEYDYDHSSTKALSSMDSLFNNFASISDNQNAQQHLSSTLPQFSNNMRPSITRGTTQHSHSVSDPSAFDRQQKHKVQPRIDEPSKNYYPSNADFISRGDSRVLHSKVSTRADANRRSTSLMNDYALFYGNPNRTPSSASLTSYFASRSPPNVSHLSSSAPRGLDYMRMAGSGLKHNSSLGRANYSMYAAPLVEGVISSPGTQDMTRRRPTMRPYNSTTRIPTQKMFLSQTPQKSHSSFSRLPKSSVMRPTPSNQTTHFLNPDQNDFSKSLNAEDGDSTFPPSPESKSSKTGNCADEKEQQGITTSDPRIPTQVVLPQPTAELQPKRSSVAWSWDHLPVPQYEAMDVKKMTTKQTSTEEKLDQCKSADDRKGSTKKRLFFFPT